MVEGVDVSVLLIAYSHVDFIGQALDSVRMQKDAGSIEIIVHDDCSTDGTREYILAAAERDPRIHPVLADQNSASNAVVRRPLELARGRYVCVLDGDDYWTCSDKLARQKLILDSDPSLAGCFHNAIAVWPDDKTTAIVWTEHTQPRRTGRNAIWEGNPFATATGMLRRSALRDVTSDWYDQFFLTDWPLYVAATMHGDLLFVDEQVAVYRQHPESSFAARTFEERLKQIAEFYRRTGRGLAAYGVADEMAHGAGSFFGGLARHHLARGEAREARACLRYGAFTSGTKRTIGRREWAHLFLATFASPKLR